MSTIPPQRAAGRNNRAFGSALLWSLLCGGVVGALIGLGVSLALPWSGSIEISSIIAVVNLVLQSLALLSWYLVPLGATLGLLVGFLVGLAYPLIRGLRGTVARVVTHSVISGVLASALWFVVNGLPAALLDRGFLGANVLNAAVLGAAFALVTVPTARYTVYRSVPAV